MFDIGFMELLVIGIVALIVVGPKDLPGMFRTLGRFTAKVRGMAREFQRAMNDAADQSGMKETAAGLKDMTSSKSLGLDTLNKAADSFEKWDPAKSSKAPPKSGSMKPEGPNTAKMREEQAAKARKLQEETAARLAAAKDAEGARAAFTSPSAEPAKPSPTHSSAPAPAQETREHRPVRPPEGHRKNMPKKTAARPQRRGR
ncbi:Sec-independent protein translocase protein TatB [Ovoidimarina sediminis]|uniref:Sec-independent protein translocase protein TatB n=1 Tax=Ovoidimarina sediminis TaxID=3079856 RepID=UPI002910D2CB|nr:Sec-independent protein translocase protein TatB [Rhodophyticola sp. MJ-SS7]MDU8945908.1 Sec-independent protein translocase protein TatB [Rhodophyticola sp. MJ-SS7]